MLIALKHSHCFEIGIFFVMEVVHELDSAASDR
jgi:hypothetical protein